MDHFRERPEYAGGSSNKHTKQEAYAVTDRHRNWKQKSIVGKEKVTGQISSADSSQTWSIMTKSLVVTHYSKRYEEEKYDSRHKLENARTLCVDCHNMETAKHQIEEWIKRMNECPWLKKLE